MEHRVVSDIVYLYGFVPSDTSAPPADLRGIGEAAVTLLDIGAVQAAVSHLNDPDYRLEQIEQRLNDLDWVGEQGVAHERVVAWFVDHADILPARLFTMHSSEAALRNTVRATASQLAERLQVFTGRREWDLKVAYDASRLQKNGAELSPELRALADEIAAAPPGRRYLLKRKRTDLTKQTVRLLAQQLAQELFEALAAHALDTRLLPLSPEFATTGNVVLRAALLVDRAADAVLRRDAAQRMENLATLGVIASFSGPWAPYRFVDNDVVA
jgi:Gas vesicle synthesis protein GvpL/GvpF